MSGSPSEKGKGKGKNKAAGELQTASPGAGTSPGNTSPVPEGGKKKKKHGQQGEPGAMTSPAAGSGTEMSPGVTPDSGKPGKGGKNRRGEQIRGTPSGPATSPEGTNAPEMKQKEKGKNFGTPAGGTIPQGISDEPSAGNQKKKVERQPQVGPPPSSQSGAPAAPSNASMDPQGGEQPQGGKAEGKKKSGESPSPTPQ
jgi:hypothetical protein